MFVSLIMLKRFLCITIYLLLQIFLKFFVTWTHLLIFSSSWIIQFLFGIRFAPPTTCDTWGLNSTNEAFVSIASNSFYKLTNSLGYFAQQIMFLRKIMFYPQHQLLQLFHAFLYVFLKFSLGLLNLMTYFFNWKFNLLIFSSHFGDLSINNEFCCLNLLASNLDSLANRNHYLAHGLNFSLLFDHDLFFKIFPIFLIFKNLSFKLNFFPISCSNWISTMCVFCISISMCNAFACSISNSIWTFCKLVIQC